MNKFQSVFTLDNIQFLLKGAGISLLVAVIALIAGTALGVLLTTMRISKKKWLRGIAKVYVEVIRGTPMLLQIMFFYLGIASLYQEITGSYLSISALFAGIVAISLNSGAYSSELIRGTIMSIDKGQWEAGKSLGMTHSQIMRKIILPQVFKRLVPPLVNEFIVLIKDSSLLSTIGVIDLMAAQKSISVKLYTVVLPMLGAGVIYLIMTLIISAYATKLERRLQESD